MGPVREHDIDAPPRFGIDQLPGMPAADRVLGQQHGAGLEDEMLIGAGLEIERTAQGDDELTSGCGVPGEGAARNRLLKRHARDRHDAAHQIAANARSKVDPAFLEMRVLVVAGPQANAADHLVNSRFLDNGRRVDDRSMGLFNWQEIGACNTPWPISIPHRTTPPGRPAFWRSSRVMPTPWASWSSEPLP